MRDRTTDWTTREVDELTRLWLEGQTASAIGRHLGLSKAAIIGKAHRLRLPPRPSPILLIAADIERGARRDHGAALPAVPPTDRDTEASRERRRAHFQALRLSRRGCAWPIWGEERPTHQHCGSRAVRGRPYCVEHCVTAFILVEPRRQRAAAALARLAGGVGTNAADTALNRIVVSGASE